MSTKFIVKKAIREHVRDTSGGKLRCSDEFFARLDDYMEYLIDEGMKRAKGNRRATLREVDV